MALFEFRVKSIDGGYTGGTFTVVKSPLLYLARLLMFFETSIFVLDQKGFPLVFNKFHQYDNFMNRACRYNACLDYKGQHESADKCNSLWREKGLTEEMIRKEKLSPYYPAAYHDQFFLEHEFSRRIIVPFWTPTEMKNFTPYEL